MPKMTQFRGVHFEKITSEAPTPGEVAGTVDLTEYIGEITEYIMEGGFSMNTDRDKYIQRDEVLDFVQNVLGINPEIVKTIVIRENTIDVELVTLHIVD